MAENDAADAGGDQAAPVADAAAATGTQDKASPQRGVDGKFAKKEGEEGPQPSSPPAGWGDIVKGIGDEKIRGQLERFTSLEEAGKGILNLRQQISTAREGFVRPPYEGMSEDERKAWQKAAGIPDAPAAYGIAPPEGADDAAKDRYGRALDAFHKIGAPRSAVELAFKLHDELAQEAVTAQSAAFDAELKAKDTELRQEWGADYQRNEGLAQRAVAHLAPELVELLGQFELDKHPTVKRVFARIGQALAEDVPAIAMEQATIVDQYQHIEAEYYDRMAKGTLNDSAFQARWAEANRRRYGSGKAA